MGIMNSVCNVVGFAYPAYCSFKVLERAPVRNAETAATGVQVARDQGVIARDEATVNEHTQWLMYWMVFSLFYAAEYWFGWMVSWFPSYTWCKLALILWLQAPQTQGARWVYDKFLRNLLLKHEPEIDRRLAEARERSVSGVTNLASSDTARQFGQRILTQVTPAAMNLFASANAGAQPANAGTTIPSSAHAGHQD